MQRFVRFFVSRHLLVNVMAVVIAVLGWFFVKDVPREYIPSINAPIIWIRAQLPGASARDIETKLTIPIEEAIDEMDGIDEYHTVISDNLSFTTVELFIDFSDDQIQRAKQDLRNAVEGITDFPPEMEDEPTLEQFDPDRWPVVEVALSGPPSKLFDYAPGLERRLKRVDGVSRATVVGLPDPEVRVLVDPVKATAHGVTLLDVVDAINRRNVSATGGVLETSADRRQVIVWSRFDKPEQVADTVLMAGSASGTVRIRDVARIESTREDVGLKTHTDGEPGLSIVVRKRANADQIDTVEAVAVHMAGERLPPGVTYMLVNDRSFYARNRLEVMMVNGALGAVLVALVLLVFMRGRTATWVLVGIPIVFLGALAVFGNTGLTLNLMTLTGLVIVLGMIVDDAIVVAERIDTLRGEGMTGVDAAVLGATEMARPVVAAALTTILAFMPMMAIGGLPGKIMWQIPAMVVLALTLSLFESFCILPAHMSGVSSSGGLGKRPFVLQLESAYRRLLEAALRHRILVVVVMFGGLAAILLVVRPLVPFVLFPQDDARQLFLKVTAPVGTPLEQTEAVVVQLERTIQQIAAADLAAVTARIGHQDHEASDKDRGDAENEALITAIFKDLDRRYTNAEWIQILKRRLSVPPGTRLVFQSEFQGPPTDQPVTLHLLAEEDAARRSTALEIASYLRAIPGLTEVDIDEKPGTPQLDLNLNYEKLARLGLTAQNVARTLQAAFFGIEASEHRDMHDTTELRVQFDPAARTDLQALLDTPVRASSGALVRLRDVVNPVETPGVSRLFHRNGLRSTTVRASFTPDSGLSALAFAERLERELLPRYADVPGLEMHVGGEAEQTEETAGELGQVAVLVVAGIGLVIWILLGSFLEALFVMVAIPFAVAGVILTFWLHGKPLSMFAMMGTIGLAGVVVNASIVMVDSVHRRIRDRAPHETERELMLDAVVARLRPITVTTLTTLGGVFPTAYGIGGYDSMVSPMSLALGWGLTLSTLVTLVLVPVLYSSARDIKARFGTHAHRHAAVAESAGG